MCIRDRTHAVAVVNGLLYVDGVRFPRLTLRGKVDEAARRDVELDDEDVRLINNAVLAVIVEDFEEALSERVCGESNCCGAAYLKRLQDGA